MIRVSIPSYQKVEGNGDSYTAYRVDVFQSGSYHTLHKRYSEFEELHKQLKKIIVTPEFPPKKVLKFNQKIVEQRRVALEAYLQVKKCPPIQALVMDGGHYWSKSRRPSMYTEHDIRDDSLARCTFKGKTEQETMPAQSICNISNIQVKLIF
ncbi:sorting nexin-24-like isoform X2 [Mercenaria mercenaria]|uniref:sorting nexin-24-like isoform X2 n=1 Tax=Mercenaria mercenaria TaxID=6596 RepID=UPI001E1D282E|nr:sorting nexin-24-like isoform X2 [Mercenaria mercenaria]